MCQEYNYAKVRGADFRITSREYAKLAEGQFGYEVESDTRR